MVKISLPAWDMGIVLKNKYIYHLNIDNLPIQKVISIVNGK